MEKLEKSLKKANKKARNIAVTKKATGIPTHPEVLGRVVPGKMKIDVRKLKLTKSLGCKLLFLVTVPIYSNQ
jgi:hypothetical protein